MSITALTTQKKVNRTLLRKIEDIVNHIAKSIEPSAIYLIGSVHRGLVHNNSDVDLIAIIPRARSLTDTSKVLPTRPHMEIPLDLHIFSSHEFESKKEIGGLCFEAYNNGTLKYRSSRS